MQDRRDAFNDSRHLEIFHSFEEEGADECYFKKNINDAMIQEPELQTLDVGCRSTPNGLLIITSPLLYQGSSKSARQCENQANKPQYVDRNG